MGASKARVLIVDDHALLRAGVSLLLEKRGGLTVVGEAMTGQAALVLAQELQPDLVLLDLSMPGLGGLDVIASLLKLAPHAKILVLTMHEDAQYLRAALKKGAAGYVLKKAADDVLHSAIAAVLRGETYVPPSLSKRCTIEKAAQAPDEQEGVSWHVLSAREQEVLSLVAMGHTSAEIADTLGLSPKTVETYRARGMEKLHLTTRAALVKFALSEGRLPIE